MKKQGPRTRGRGGQYWVTNGAPPPHPNIKVDPQSLKKVEGTGFTTLGG